MKSDNPRERLGFERTVAQYLKPILITCEFICTESTLYLVKFESLRVVTTMSHDRLSYEIEVAFARKAELAQRFTLADVLRAALGPGHDQQKSFQASKAQDVEWCVKTIAGLLERYGQAILEEQPAAYRRVAKIAHAQNNTYTKQVVQKPIRDKAEKAWRNQDYAQVRDIYESIESDLTSLEKRRRIYACGKIKEK
jgi:hypothetical protein